MARLCLKAKVNDLRKVMKEKIVWSCVWSKRATNGLDKQKRKPAKRDCTCVFVECRTRIPGTIGCKFVCSVRIPCVALITPCIPPEFTHLGVFSSNPGVENHQQTIPDCEINNCSETFLARESGRVRKRSSKHFAKASLYKPSTIVQARSTSHYCRLRRPCIQQIYY
jgi:hypothetical protein